MRTKAVILAGLCGLAFSSTFSQTAGKNATYVEVLAVNDGKMALAGGKDAAFKLKGDSTKLVDLDGKHLMPSFIAVQALKKSKAEKNVADHAVSHDRNA